MLRALVETIAPELRPGVQQRAAARGGAPGYRAFLGVTGAWFVWKALILIREVLERPEFLLQRNDWVAYLLPFSRWKPLIWLIAVLSVGAGIACLRGAAKRRLSTMLRTLILILAFISNSLQQTAGGYSHWNHFIILGLLFGLFLPLEGDFNRDDEVGYRLFHLAMLLPYSVAGMWKLLHIAWALKEGSIAGSWLESSATIETLRSNEIRYERDLAVEPLVEFLQPVWPYLFVLFAALLTSSFLAALNRSTLLIIAPAVGGFHLFNFLAFGAEFRWTAIAAPLLLFPYELLTENLRRSIRQGILHQFPLTLLKPIRRRRAGS